MKKNVLMAMTVFAVFILSFLAGAAWSAETDKGSQRLLSLGDSAPDFTLPDVVSGRMVSLGDFAGKKVVLVVFLCRHCPYVVHVKEGLVQMVNDYAGADLAVIAISSNDASKYPLDAPDKLREMAVSDSFPMPLLYDESQDVARAYTAVCTPEFFLFDASRKLVYRGQFDDSRPGSGTPVTGKDLRAAVDAVLAGKPVPEPQTPAVGCSIKWKK